MSEEGGTYNGEVRVSRAWQVQEAKAKFSAVLDAAEEEGPQLVTRRGRETAVIVSIEEWRRLTDQKRPTLKDALLNPSYRGEIPLFDRSKVRSRPLPGIFNA